MPDESEWEKWEFENFVILLKIELNNFDKLNEKWLELQKLLMEINRNIEKAATNQSSSQQDRNQRS